MQLARHGGLIGIRDQALLDAALQEPLAMFEGEPEISVNRLATVYVSALAKGKPFEDANKRTGLVAGATFLYENGWLLKAEQPDTVIATFRLVSGEWSTEQFSNWLEQHSVRV